MGNFIYKPSTRKGPIFLHSGGKSSPPTITLSNGTVITGKYLNTIDEGGGPNSQYVFPTSVLGQTDATLSFGGATQKLGNSNLSYRGDSIGSLQESSKGAVGSSTGVPPGFDPGNIGGGYFGAYQGGSFPSPFLSKYNPIKPADYKYTDPFKFAEKYGEFNRGEISKNFNLAQDLALKELDTELAGLRSFVPGAAALKRNEISIDNQFNQAQRTKQIDETLPGVRADLQGQTDRANAFASGRLPSSIEDRAYEVGVRSKSADQSYAGGFGTQSSVARKASDLLSAEARVNLSKYGDQLLTSNIGTKSNLLLAPTEYSDAGNQIRVMPEVGAGRLTSQNLTEANNLTTIPTQTAFAGEVQQNQFRTNQVQGTRQFNATNQLQNAQFNAANQNQFALTKFQYDVGFAGSVAGAAQTDFNTQFALQQQQRYNEIFQDALKNSQSAQQTQSIFEAIGALITNFNSLKNLFTSDSSAAKTTTTTPTGNTSTPSDGGQSTSPTGSIYPSGSDVGGSSDSISVPSGNTVPDGFTGVGTGSDGSTIAVPDTSSNNFSTQAASASTGLPFSDATPKSSASMVAKSGAVLSSAGIHSSPQPGTEPAGVNTGGNPVYKSSALARSNDTSKGSATVNTLKDVLSPMGVFSNKKDADALDNISSAAGDVSFIAQLTDSFQRGDTKGFVNSLLTKFQQPIISKLTDDPQNQAGLGAAFTATQLFSNWDKMSPAQRSLAVANMGLQGYKFATGENLANKFLIEDPSVPGGGLTVGQGLSLFQAGYNTYSLVKNWNQMNTIQKIAAGTGDAAQIASLAQQFNLLGAGTEGAAVATSAEALNSVGFVSTPYIGLGAGTVPAGTAVPAGYSAVGTAASGETMIVPAANASSVSYLQQGAGYTAVAAGAYQVYQGWGGGGSKGAINGAIGGSMIAAGLYTAGATGNPYVLAAIVASSIIADATGGQKSGDQMKRDKVRSFLQTNGVADKDFNVTLADGSKFDIGVDGHGQQRGVSHPELLVKEQKDIKKLNAWDIDYTNDLDYVAGMGGINLTRLLAGGKATQLDHIGSQMGNAALSTVGYGKEMSQGNFTTVMQNMRSLYAQSGIKSKSDMYQLANQGFAENRFDASEHAAMLQTADMVFDNDYKKAQGLMAGRFRGIEVATENPSQAKEPSAPPQQAVRPPGAPSASVVGTISPNSQTQINRGNKPAMSAPEAAVAQGIERLKKVNKSFGRSKEDIRRMNQERYGVQAA